MRYIALKLHQVLVRSGAAVRAQLGKRQFCPSSAAWLSPKTPQIGTGCGNSPPSVVVPNTLSLMHTSGKQLSGTPMYLHASFCMTRAFVVFSEKMGLKRPMGILQNQTSGLLQLILYKRHGKVVGDTLFFERLTQGVTEEAHAHRSHF